MRAKQISDPENDLEDEEPEREEPNDDNAENSGYDAAQEIGTDNVIESEDVEQDNEDANEIIPHREAEKTNAEENSHIDLYERMAIHTISDGSDGSEDEDEEEDDDDGSEEDEESEEGDDSENAELGEEEVNHLQF